MLPPPEASDFHLSEPSVKCHTRKRTAGCCHCVPGKVQSLRTGHSTRRGPQPSDAGLMGTQEGVQPCPGSSFPAVPQRHGRYRLQYLRPGWRWGSLQSPPPPPLSRWHHLPTHLPVYILPNAKQLCLWKRAILVPRFLSQLPRRVGGEAVALLGSREVHLAHPLMADRAVGLPWVEGDRARRGNLGHSNTPLRALGAAPTPNSYQERS